MKIAFPSQKSDSSCTHQIHPMDIVDKLRALASRLERQRESIKTEEGTKTSFILPFIAALGYDIFDPHEVNPESIADVGVKKGEKVDYAIMRDGKAVMLIECKALGTDLKKEHASQLFRYFSVTPARIGILTNGESYRFFSDLEEPNKMDSVPFMEFDLMNFTDESVIELKRFGKSNFELEQVVASLADIKYNKEVRRILREQMERPSEEFIRFFAKQIHTGVFNERVRLRFEGIVKQAMNQVVVESVNDRIKSALTPAPASVSTGVLTGSNSAPAPAVAAAEPDTGKVLVTTEDELEAFRIVRAIFRKSIKPSRVVMRDQQSYCGILLDDNNRKPLCRLYFNNPARKQIGIFDENKIEQKIPIEELDEIYDMDERLLKTPSYYAKEA